MNKNVSVLMPVLNETWSLEETTDIVIKENTAAIKELILIIHPTKTLPASLAITEKLQATYPEIIRIEKQSLPFIGGAIRKGFETASGEFTLMMVCDLETDPRLVKEMISRIQAPDTDMVTASRWIKGGSFSGYGLLKKNLNFIFQKMFGLLYQTNLTDMTYGFRIFKTPIVKNIKWTSLTHEIFFETLLKPLRLGYKIKEVPAQWSAREEGESQIRLSYFFKYFYIGFVIRCLPKKHLMTFLKNESF